MKKLYLQAVRVAKAYLKRADYARAEAVAKMMWIGGVNSIGPEESKRRLQRSYGLSPEEAEALFSEAESIAREENQERAWPTGYGERFPGSPIEGPDAMTAR